MLDATSQQPREQGALGSLVEHTHTACLVHQNCFELSSISLMEASGITKCFLLK